MYGMKKVLLFIALTLVFCTMNVKAYTMDEVIERTNSSKSNLNKVLDDIVSWSNKYKIEFKNTITIDVASKLTGDIQKDLDILSNEMKSLYPDASNGLINIKNNRKDDLIYLRDTFEIIKDYLNENKDYGVICSLDVFVAVKNLILDVKPKINTIFDTYYDLYFAKLEDKLNNVSSGEDLKDLYNLFDKNVSVISKLFDKYSNINDSIQNLYNDYELDDYEIYSYFNNLSTKINNDYEKMMSKLSSKWDSVIDSKIELYSKDLVLTDNDTIVSYNNKLYGLMNNISEYNDKLNETFNKAYKYIRIESLNFKLNKKTADINELFDSKVVYVSTYLKDEIIPSLDKKDDNDKNLNINNVSKLLSINYTNLDKDNVLDKVEVKNASTQYLNLYNGNVGTKTKLVLNGNNGDTLEYTIIVKGDVASFGAIDITDVVGICNKMFGKKTFDEYEMLAADINDDGNIDITDIVKLCNKIFGR